MAEISARRGSSGLRAISTFSGAGGGCLGLEDVGFEVLAASEFVEAAREVYEANHPGVPVDGRDVRELSAEDLLELGGVEAGELDLLEGSPPCASFSTAGKRSEHWGEEKPYSDTQQRSDDLFFEFARLVAEARPRAFVAENVSGLIKGVAKGYYLRIFARLEEAGYVVSSSLLDSQWLGVPQARQRIFFVGVRRDLAGPGDAPFSWPTPLPYRYSVLDAIGDLPPVVDSLDPETGESVALGAAVAREWAKLPVGGQSERYFQLVRSDPDLPVGTVTASGGNVGLASVSHPFECRKFTIRELRRLSGFPDDFVLSGTYQQRYERIGRAVPPPMMAAVAARLVEVLS